MELNLSLHPGQLRVFEDPARFKAVAAGRRWGKTRLAVIELLTRALANETVVNKKKRSLAGVEAWYVAPTYDQARDIVWDLLKDLAAPVIDRTWENDGKIRLINGRCIQIKGSDRPDRLRGVGLSHVVLDEFASMKPETWDTILRPTLADVGGSATFIGTPLGKNWFYDLYRNAFLSDDWSAWHFESEDNPYLPTQEVAAAKASMPREIFKQEFEASFETSNKLIFPYDLIECSPSDVPRDAAVYMAVDHSPGRDGYRYCRGECGVLVGYRHRLRALGCQRDQPAYSERGAEASAARARHRAGHGAQRDVALFERPDAAVERLSESCRSAARR